MRALESAPPCAGAALETRLLPRATKELFADAQTALEGLIAVAVRVLDGHAQHAELPPLVERTAHGIRRYHAALVSEAMPALVLSGRAGRTLASHVEHLSQLQAVALAKLSQLGARVQVEPRAVRELIVTSLVLAQDLEAQRHYLGESHGRTSLPGAA